MNTAIQSVPVSLLEAVQFYSDPAECFNLMVEVRWPNDVLICPHCESFRVTKFSTRPLFKCNSCKKQFSVKVGTIFEDSPLPLNKWLAALWLLTNCKNGISSCEVARDLDITQKSAWFMLHRLRYAMKVGSLEKKLNGEVEADETFIGGLEKNKHENKKLHAGRGAVGKTIVMGVLERNEKKQASQVRAQIIPDTSKVTLKGVIKAEVAEFATVYTDAWKGYNGLTPEYIHQFVDHAICYAIGRVHSNGIENFWSLLKRCLKGTYISVEPFHLEAYIDEQVFRFNHRGGNDRDRFIQALGQISGKRLTYDELTSSFEAYYQQTMPV